SIHRSNHGPQAVFAAEKYGEPVADRGGASGQHAIRTGDYAADAVRAGCGRLALYPFGVLAHGRIARNGHLAGNRRAAAYGGRGVRFSASADSRIDLLAAAAASVRNSRGL